MEAWNTRDPPAFAATLQYPHVRPTADFGGRVFADASAYAATIDFDQVLATGWDRSRLDSAIVVQAGEGQAHVAGRYTRLRADGSAIFSNQVLYVVTEKDGSIGIQARLAAGFDDLSGHDREATASAAIAAVERYLAAFNDRDEEAMVAALHFPHVRVGVGGATVRESAAEYMEGFDFDAVISVEEAGYFKPHHATYAKACELLGVGRSSVLFVANHAFDCIGAKAYGMRTAFIDRRRRSFGDSPHQPDLIVENFTALARALCG